MKFEENAGKTVGAGAAVLLLSTIIVKLIGALFKIPLSADICLGDLGFGYFSSAYDLYTPIYMLAISGLPIAISRIIADSSDAQKAAKGNLVISTALRLFVPLGILGSLLFLVAVFPIISLADKTGEGIYAFAAIAPSVLLCFAISCYRGYFEGQCNMRPSAVSNIIEALCKLGLGFTLAFVTVKLTDSVALGAVAAIFGIVAGQVVALIYLRVKFKRLPHSLPVCFDKEISKALLISALPAALISLSGSMVPLIDAIFVRSQLNDLVNNDFNMFAKLYSSIIKEYNSKSSISLLPEELPTLLYGIRSKAFTLYNLVPTLTTAIGVSATPVVAAAVYGEVERSVTKALKLAAVITFPAGFGFMAVGQNVMALLYGQGASALVGGKMLSIYGAAAIFAGLSIPLSCILQALKKGKAVLLNVGIGIAVKLVINLVLTRNVRINIFGAAFGTLGCFAVICILNLILLAHTLGGKVLMGLVKPLIASVLCGSIAYLLSHFLAGRLMTLGIILIAAMVYFVALGILKIFADEEILELPFGRYILKLCEKLKFLR